MSLSREQRLAQEFWDFSCALYAQDEVKQICLQCQDEHDLSVNLLLFCLWQGGACKQVLQPGFFQHDLVEFERVNRDVLEPFRKKRRESPQKTQAPWLYNTMLQMELKLERQVQETLVAAVVASKHVAKATTPTSALMNLGSYLQYRGISPSQNLLEKLRQLVRCLE